MKMLISSLQHFRAIDDFSHEVNFMTVLDPRAKMISSFAILLAIVSQGRYEVSALLPFCLYPMIIMTLSDIPIKFIGDKILLIAPFALLIGIFNPLMDHTLWSTPWGSDISAGWLSLVSIFIRVVLCVSIAILLLATTGIYPIVSGLMRLGVPSVLTTQIYLLYQFFYITAEEIIAILKSYQLRSLSKGRGVSFRLYKQLMVTLFNKTLLRCTRIYNAMLSRGFSGTWSNVTTIRWSKTDSIWVSVWVVFALLCVTNNIPFLLGTFFMR